MATTTLGEILVKLGIDAASFDREITRVQRSIKNAAEDITRLGSKMTAGITLPLIGMGTLAVREFAQFETALAGVAKETDASSVEIAEFGRQVTALSTRIPIAREALAGIGETAVELGAPVDGLTELTEVAARFGAVAEISSEQAVASLIKLSSAFDEPIAETRRLASAIASLNAPEEDVLAIAQKIADTGRSIGLSTSQVLAFAGATAKLGTVGTSGAFTLATLFREIGKAAAGSSDRLEAFAQVAVMSGDELRRAFREDAAGSILRVLAGLDRIREAGNSVIPVLERLGLGSGRSTEAILGLARSTGDLAVGMESASSAWASGTQIFTDSDRLFGTLSNRFETFKNRLDAIAGSIGEALAPAVSAALSRLDRLAARVQEIAEGFARLDPATRDTVVAIAGITAAIGPALVVLGGFVGVLGVIASHPVILALSLMGAAAVSVAAQFLDADEALRLAKSAIDEASDAFVRLRQWVSDVATGFSDATAGFRSFAAAVRDGMVEIDRALEGRLSAAAGGASVIPPFLQNLINGIDRGLEALRKRGEEVRKHREAFSEENLLRSLGMDEPGAGSRRRFSEGELADSLGIPRSGELFPRGFEIDTTKAQRSLEEAREALREKMRTLFGDEGVVIPFDLDSQAVSKALKTLDTELASIGVRAEAFGASFDAVSFEASQLTAALNALIGQGVGPLDPRIQTIVQRLGELQNELGRREGAIAFRDWIADVNREIQSLERQGVERLNDVLADMDQRLRDMDLSPVELELQRIRDSVAQVIETFQKAGQEVPAHVREIADAIEQRLPALGQKLEEDAKAIKINVGETFANAFGSIFEGFLSGTRDLKPFEVLRDAAIGVLGEIFTETLKKKLAFDVELKNNLLTDALGTFRDFAAQAGKAIGSIFGLVPKESVAGIEAQVQADVAAKVASVDVPAPEAERAPGLDLGLVRRALSQLSETVQLTFARLRDGVLDSLSGLADAAVAGFARVGEILRAIPVAAAEAFGKIVETLRAIPSLVDLSGLEGVFASLRASVLGAFQSIRSGVVAALGGISATVEAGFTRVASIAGRIPELAVSAFLKVAEALRSIPDALDLSGVARVFGRLSDAVQGVFAGVRDEVLGVLGGLGGAISASVGTIARQLAEIPTAASGAFDALVRSLRALPSRIDLSGIGRSAAGFSENVIGAFEGISARARTVLGGIAPVVEGVFGRIVAFAGSLPRQVSAALSGAVDFSRLERPLRAIREVAALAFGGFAEIARGGLAQLRAGVLGSLSGVASLVSGIFSRLVTFSRGAAAEVAQAISGAGLSLDLSGVRRSLSDLSDAVQGTFAAVRDSALAAVARVPDAVAGAFGGVVEFLSGIGATLSRAFAAPAALGSNLVSTISRGFEAALGVARGFATGLRGVFGAIGEGVRSLSGFGSEVTRALAGASAGVEGFGADLSDRFRRVFAEAATLAQGFGSGLLGELRGTLAGLRDGVLGVVRGLAGAASGLFDRIVPALSALPGAAASAFGEIVAVLRAIPAQLDLSGIGRVFAALSTSVQSIFAGLRDDVVGSLGGLTSAAGGAFARIAGSLRAIPEAATEAFGAVVQALRGLGGFVDVSGITAALSGFSESAVAVFVRVRDGIESVVGGLATSVTSAFGGVAGVLARLPGAASEAFGSVLESIRALPSLVDLSGAVRALTGFSEAATGAFGRLRSQAELVIDGLGGALAGGIARASSAIEAIPIRAAEAFRSVFEALGDLPEVLDLSGVTRTLGGIPEAVVSTFSRVRSGLVGVLFGIDDAATGAFSGVLDVLRRVPDAATGAFEAVVETLRSIPDLVDLSGVARSFGGISDTLRASFARIGESILDVVQGIGPGVRGAFDVALRFLGTLPAQVGVLVAGIGEPLLDALRALPGRAGALAEGLGSELGTGLSRAFSGVRSLVDAFGRSLGQGFEGALGSVLGLFEGLPAALRAGLGGVADFGSDLIAVLSRSLGDAGSSAARFATGFAESVAGAFEGALGSLRNLGGTIASILSEATEGGGGAAGGLVDALSDAFEGVRGLGADLGQNVAQGLGVALGAARDFAGRFGEGLAGAFGALSGQLGGIGAAVSGFTAALVEGVGGAFDAVRGLVPGFAASLTAGVGEVFGQAVVAVQGLGAGLAGFATQLGGSIEAALGSGLRVVQGFGSDFVSLLGGIFNQGLSVMQRFAGELVNLLSQIGPSVLSALGPMLSQIGSFIGGAGSGVGDFFSAIIPAVAGAFGGAPVGFTGGEGISKSSAFPALDLSHISALSERGIGGGTAPIINITNNAGNDVQVSAQAATTPGPDGKQVIEIMVERAARNSLARGGLRHDMSQSFGIAPNPSMR